MIGLPDFVDAARLLRDVLRPTPAAVSPVLSAFAARPIAVKPEHLQRTGSFKIRGAYNRIARLAAAGEATEVVAASAGNHAQGVALAASLCGLDSTIFMPTGAALPKVQATRAYGSTVEFAGASVDDAIDAARDHARRSGAFYVPPFDDELVVAGQGTIGLELAGEVPEADVYVVPVGGGGLASGIAAALKACGSRARVVGVEAAGATAMLAALDHGSPVVVDAVDTMADGIAVRCVSDLTLSMVRDFVDDIVTVDEEEISQAVLLLLERCKWVVEPAGAVSLAAILAGRVAGSGLAVAVASGGNVDPLLLTRLVEHGLSAAGRFATIRVVLPDKPGALAGLTVELGKLGLNLLTVEHRRFGPRTGINEVEVTVTMETRDPMHRDEIVSTLLDLGFRAEEYH